MAAGVRMRLLSASLAICFALGLTISAQGQNVSIAACGDVLLDRGVAAEIRQHGVTYPFSHVRSTLRKADIAFANLECPLVSGGIPVVKKFTFHVNPTSAACLNDAGLDILSVANNHTLDYGRSGLVQTMDTLGRHKLAWCGAGKSLADATKPTIRVIHGVRVAFVGFCDFVPVGVFLRDDRPTQVMASEENIRQSIALARQEADVVVASFHWGIEFSPRPSDRQRHLGRYAAKCGADLVLGHHPHVLEGFEIARNGSRRTLIAYSLGNFVFDQRLGFNHDRESTLILNVILSKSGLVSASFLPAVIDHCAPTPATGADAMRIESRLKQLSAELNTKVEGNQIRFNE